MSKSNMSFLPVNYFFSSVLAFNCFWSLFWFFQNNFFRADCPIAMAKFNLTKFNSIVMSFVSLVGAFNRSFYVESVEDKATLENVLLKEKNSFFHILCCSTKLSHLVQFSFFYFMTLWYFKALYSVFWYATYDQSSIFLSSIWAYA